ncbi:MAG: glucokinase [Caldimonas sp.]
MRAGSPYPRLLADLGGTHMRFGWTRGPGDGITALGAVDCADFERIENAIAAGLGRRTPPPASFAMAVAAPVSADTVCLTNLGWTFSIASLQRTLGLERLVVLNDFAALALAIPSLKPEETWPVGGGQAVPGAAVAVLGPGTGLGVSGLFDTPDGPRQMPSEGGHASLSAGDAVEDQLLAVLRNWYGHVSFERVVSGPGIVNLYRAHCELAGLEAAPYDAEVITARADEGSDACCVAAVESFFGFLGAFAGNLALTLAARGGVYLGGGIVPRLGQRIVTSNFRSRFEGKGRFRDYLAGIPTRVIAHPSAATLRGADIALDRPAAPALA